MRIVLLICVGLLAMAGLTWVYDNYSGYVRDHYNRKRYPPIKSSSPLAEDLKAEIAKRRRGEIVKEYRRVGNLLTAAARQGYDVRYLRKKMPRIADLIKKGSYNFAKIHLNTIDVRIPRKKKRERIRVLSDRDFGGETTPVPAGRAQPRKSRPRKRRR